MSPFAYAETLTVLRRGSVVYPTMGDAPAVATSTPVDGCALWPTLTAELVTGQDTVNWDMEALFPPDTDIVATDQVIARGITYDVVGQPMDWRSQLTGKRPGIQVQLKAATG